MTNGVISLRCLKCTRPFLSLQQQAGALVTCPHCAQSAPASAFPPAGSGPLHATALPVRRRVASLRPELESQLAPPPGFGYPALPPAPPLPVPGAAAPIPGAHPHYPNGATMARPTGQVRWPPAPEQPPMFTPPIHPEDLPPEPDMQWAQPPPGYPPQPPQAHAYRQPGVVPNSPFGVAGGLPPRMPPTVPLPHAAFPFQTASSPFQALPPGQAPAVGPASLGALPPLAGAFALAGSPFQPVAFPGEVPPLRPSAAEAAVPPRFHLPGEGPGPGANGAKFPPREALNQNPPENWRPPARHRSMGPVVLLLILVVGGCLWVLRNDLLPALHVDIPAPSAPKAVTTPAPALEPGNAAADAEADPLAPAGPVPTVKPGQEKSAEPPAPPAAAPPEPEVRRAELPLIPAEPEQELSTEERAGVTAAALPLVEALFHSSTTPEARRELILHPEDHAAAVEAFFKPKGQAAGPARPELVSMRALTATPLSLPGLKPAVLFQVVTRANPAGALLRLARPAQGGADAAFRMDWPLFLETHERRLATFLKAAPPGQAEKPKSAWFYVILRRTHALDLPADVRETHVLFDAQASADASVRAVMAAPRESPVGRALESDAKWGQVFLARLLVQHRTLRPGVPLLVILDCDKAGEGD